MKYVEINDLSMGEVFINPEKISSFGYIKYNRDYDNQATIAIKMSNDDLFEVLASDYEYFEDFVDLISGECKE